MYLLSSNELEEMFSSSFLYQMNSFYVIDPKTQTYQTDRSFSSLVQYSQFVKSSFLNGSAIVVKNLEIFSSKLKSYSLKYGADVDIHMYLVPPQGASSFDFHVDDRDVSVVMVYGTKDFLLKENGTERRHTLSEGEQLHIPAGKEHKAVNKGGSCLLSFGIKRQWNYFVPGGLTQSDFPTNPEV